MTKTMIENTPETHVRLAEGVDRQGRKVFLRYARLSDGEAIWRWRQDMNLDFMRAANSPTLEEHMAWMAAALKSPDRHLYILEETVVTVEGAQFRKSLGHLRLDMVGDGVGSISILLAPDARGRRLGGIALARIEVAAINSGIFVIHAEVHVKNYASLRIFARAGYLEAATQGNFVQFYRYLSLQ